MNYKQNKTKKTKVSMGVSTRLCMSQFLEENLIH